MKATLSTEHLKPILRMLSKSSPSELWLLASEESEGSLILTIDAGGARWSLRCPADVGEEGSCYISWSRFYNLALAIEDLSMELNGDDATLDISTEMMRAHLPLTGGSLFPLQRQVNEAAAKAKFDMLTFSAAVRACMAVVGKPDEAFAYIGSMSCVVTPALGRMMATDRKRMLFKRFTSKGDAIEFTASAIQLDLIASFPEDWVDVAAQDNNIRLRASRFICDLSPYTQRMPELHERFLNDLKEASITASIDYGSLMKGLSLAQSSSSGREHVHTYLDLGRTGSRIRSNGDRTDEIDIRLEAETTQDVRIWVRPDQISSTLTSLRKAKAVTDRIILRTQSDRSTLFFPLSDDLEDFMCISAFVPAVAQ